MGCKTVVDIKYHYYGKTVLLSLKKWKKMSVCFTTKRKITSGKITYYTGILQSSYLFVEKEVLE